MLSGLKELEKNGYLTRIKLSTGKIEYHLKYYNTQAPKTPKPKLGFPQAGENATISNKEEENKKEVFLSESADSESFSVKADEKKSDVLMQNEAKLKKLISDGEFSKEKYRFPENGPFDWRYLVNNGKGLSVAKLIVAIYWREKSLDKYPGKKYSYATKGLASGVMMQEMKYAKELASMIDFWDVKKLVEVVDGKFESMFKNKPYEWKVKNLCNYAYLLNEPDGQEQ